MIYIDSSELKDKEVEKQIKLLRCKIIELSWYPLRGSDETKLKRLNNIFEVLDKVDELYNSW